MEFVSSGRARSSIVNRIVLWKFQIIGSMIAYFQSDKKTAKKIFLKRSHDNQKNWKKRKNWFLGWNNAVFQNFSN